MTLPNQKLDRLAFSPVSLSTRSVFNVFFRSLECVSCQSYCRIFPWIIRFLKRWDYLVFSYFYVAFESQLFLRIDENKYVLFSSKEILVFESPSWAAVSVPFPTRIFRKGRRGEGNLPAGTLVAIPSDLWHGCCLPGKHHYKQVSNVPFVLLPANHMNGETYS